jgi:uncharacterized repeat protein (TIGR01451 family)
MHSRVTTRTRTSVLPVLVALFLNLLLPMSPAGLGIVAAADGIDDYSQCQIGNPASGLDCESWINGILNATHNNYSEDEVVPQRLVIDFDDTADHSVTLSYMTRKDSGTQNHAYDYLATWNYTYVNADRCQNLNPNLCVGGAADVHPIPSDPAIVLPGLIQPTAVHELGIDRQFVMYGGDITSTSLIPTHTTDPSEPGSDYANITINFDVTDADGRVMLLFGGHLAAGLGPRGWGAGLGAASISGGPYHIRVIALDDASIGNRDNQIMSDAIQPLNPALTISKTPDAGTVNAGDYASFTITVTNNGPGAATNVDIDDTLPAGPGALVWSEFPDKAECTVVSNVLHCDIASLAVAASFSVTVRALTDSGDCATLNNTAFADADNNSSVSDTGSLTVQCPNLTISKTPDGGTVNAGDPISFTITVSNGGPGTATNVDIDDSLPAGFSWSEDPDKAECAITAGALHCDIASLASGASFSVTLTAATDGGDCGAVTNTATADADNHAQISNAGNVTVQCPNLVISKTPDGATVNAGQPISFGITLTNNGPGTAVNVDIDDGLPAGFAWVESPDKAECAITAGALHCDIASLGNGASFTVTVVSSTDLEDCRTHDNTATADADNHGQISDTGSVTVQCPGLNVAKEAVADPIVAGETASFTIVVWNTGPGTALDVELTDTLPAGLAWSENSAACSITSGVLSCDFGDLGISTKAASTARVTLTAATDRTDCGVLNNTAIADSNPGAPVQSSDSITVRCPVVALIKTNNQPNPVLTGTSVAFTIALAVADGPADNVRVVDTLPTGYDAPTSISNGGAYDAATRKITWNLGNLATGNYQLTYFAAVSSGVAHGTALVNVAVVTSSNSQCPSATSLAPECDDDSTVTVRVPTLVIDKVADAETITISGPSNALVATPSVVTWTLSYTLTNGPVTNGVITDTVPAGFVFLDAANGGTFANGVVTWNLGTLSASGSVSFRTTVDPATISRVAPTVNTAVIDSTETAPDSGLDSVTVTVVPPPLAGTPTPAPVLLPDTAAGTGIGGVPVTVPIELLVAFFLGSLGALALANVRASSRRR